MQHQEHLLLKMTLKNTKNFQGKKSHKFLDEKQQFQTPSLEKNELESEKHPKDDSPQDFLEDDKSEEVSSSMEENGRERLERLKRHRVEMSGRVWIPDLWGQEDFLKDWIDCSAFDSSLLSNNIMSARKALIEEGRRANSSRLRIENSC